MLRIDLNCPGVRIYVRTLTYGHLLWVVTKITRLRLQASEMTFLRRVALRDGVRDSIIQEDFEF